MPSRCLCEVLSPAWGPRRSSWKAALAQKTLWEVLWTVSSELLVNLAAPRLSVHILKTEKRVIKESACPRCGCQRGVTQASLRGAPRAK